jgi:hypothetical protein
MGLCVQFCTYSDRSSPGPHHHRILASCAVCAVCAVDQALLCVVCVCVVCVCVRARVGVRCVPVRGKSQKVMILSRENRVYWNRFRWITNVCGICQSSNFFRACRKSLHLGQYLSCNSRMSCVVCHVCVRVRWCVCVCDCRCCVSAMG